MTANAAFFAGVFALSGVLSAVMFGLGNDPNMVLAYLAGVPFAAGTLCLHGVSRRSLLIAGLTALVWPASFRTAIALASGGASNYVAVCVSGALGGAAIALIHRIGRGAAKLTGELAAIGLAGAITALPFGTWAAQGDNDPHHALLLVVGFVSWQISVSSVLVAFTNRTAGALPAAS